MPFFLYTEMDLYSINGLVSWILRSQNMQHFCLAVSDIKRCLQHYWWELQARAWPVSPSIHHHWWWRKPGGTGHKVCSQLMLTASGLLILLPFLTCGDLTPSGSMTEPQPKYSAFREASFGHAIFDIKNRSHAYYSWYRNQDGNAMEADSLWFYNRVWNPREETD